MDLVVVFALFVVMLALLFFDATVFSVNKDLYKSFIYKSLFTENTVA